MRVSALVPVALALALSAHAVCAAPPRVSLDAAARVVSKETIVGTYQLRTDSAASVLNTGLVKGQACPKSISIGPAVELPDGVKESYKEVASISGDVFGMSPDNWKISGNACESANGSIYAGYSFDFQDIASVVGRDSIQVEQFEGFEYSSAAISAFDVSGPASAPPSASVSDSLKCGDATYKISVVAAFEVTGEISNGTVESFYKRGGRYLLVTGEVPGGSAGSVSDTRSCNYVRSQSDSGPASPTPAGPGAVAEGGEGDGGVASTPTSSAAEEDEPSASIEEEDESSAACFPADALVELEDGNIVAMESLRVGDMVKVGADRFSQVVMFTHRLIEGDFEFVSLHVASSSSKSAELQLSAGHYLTVNGELKAAQSVQVGDVVNMGDGSSAAVVRVSSVVSRGLFNPQTADGNIVVNGVSASTYTTAVKPAVAHSLLWPVRQLFRATGATADLSCGILEGRSAGFEAVRALFASAV